ncbi:MAG: acetyl-CoA carboxylase biotin carboxyl carrier protein subunit [Elusimicrobiota bacterium]
MKIQEMNDINKWFKESELVELEFKRGNYKISLVKEGENRGSTKISSNLTSVVSPEIGVFNFTKKGKSVTVKEGSSVKKGDVLGYVKIMNKETEVVSPIDGKIKVVCVNEGDVVEYAQLLFILE